MNSRTGSLMRGLSLLVTLVLAPNAVAEPVMLGRMAVPIKHGFGFSMEMETAPGNGFQPVYLQFVPTARVFARERNLTVEITAGDQMQSRIDFTYRCRVQLPQNARDLRSVQYIPYYYPWSQVHVRVLEDDRPLEGCATTFMIADSRLLPLEHPLVGVVVSEEMSRFLQQSSTVANQHRIAYRQMQTRLATRPAVPHVAAFAAVVQATAVCVQDAADWKPTPSSEPPPVWQQCPDVRSLRAAFEGMIPTDTNIPRLDHTASLQQLQQVQPANVQFRTLAAQQLPEQWLAYSQLDVILIAAPLLRQLESQPAVYRALTDWLANGGNLWVYATQQAACQVLDQTPLQPVAAGLVPVKRALRQALSLNDLNDASGWEYNAYNGPSRDSQNLLQGSSMLNGGIALRQQAYDAAKQNEHAFAAEAPPAAVAGLIRHGRFGLGTVTAIDREDPFPQSFQFWTTVVRATGGEQLDWTARTGIHVPGGNTQFWSLLIAAVGQPPVKSFIGLNTLFVLIVGPICYWYLRRRQHLFLLFFVAPALALLVTGGLVVYAYLADGVRTRTRVRQITWVDPQAGYQVTQARQTYFAVLDSRRGLAFPNDAAVYPVLRGSIRSDYRYRRNDLSGIEGTVTASDDQLQFRGCFLPPRAQVQVLVANPEARAETLQWMVADTQVSVTNRLDYGLRDLTIRDQAGKLWQAAAVQSGETVSLTRLPSAQTPALDIAPLQPEVLPNLRSTRDPWGRYSVGSNASQLERSLEDWLRFLPPERFIAIAEQPEVKLLGVEDAEMTDVNHVIMGRLP